MTSLIATARVSSKGQITVPIQLRHEMGLHTGSLVTFIREDDGTLAILSSTLAALRYAQQSCAGAAQEKHIRRHEDLNRLIRHVRHRDSHSLAGTVRISLPPHVSLQHPGSTLRIMADTSVLLAAIFLPCPETQETLRICSRDPHILVISHASILEALTVVQATWPRCLPALQLFLTYADYECAPTPQGIPRIRVRHLPQRPNAAKTYITAINSRTSILLSYTRDFANLHPPHLTVMSPRTFVHRYGGSATSESPLRHPGKPFHR